MVDAPTVRYGYGYSRTKNTWTRSEIRKLIELCLAGMEYWQITFDYLKRHDYEACMDQWNRFLHCLDAIEDMDMATEAFVEYE